jgi:hypothetical protein
VVGKGVLGIPAWIGVKDGCGFQVGWGREDVWEEGGMRCAGLGLRREQVIYEGKTTKAITSMMDGQKLLGHSG